MCWGGWIVEWVSFPRRLCGLAVERKHACYDHTGAPARVNRDPDVDGDGSLPYPMHRVVGIFNAAAAPKAIAGLGEAKVPLGTVEVFSGTAGAGSLTPAEGAGGWVMRAIHTFGGEQEEIREYEEAVATGAALLSVPAESDEEKALIHDVMHAHGEG